MGILTKLREAIHDHGSRGEVRRALEIAHARRVRIELEPTGRDDNEILIATVEQIEEDAFVISQPVVNGAVRSLVRYSGFTMTFGVGGHCLSGRTRALGRSAVQTGSGKTLNGYRMEFPEALRELERRTDHRVAMGTMVSRDVELRLVDQAGAVIHALIEDVSAGGACVRCPAPSIEVRAGEVVMVDATLPEPAGRLHAKATVVHATHEREDELVLRLGFAERQNAVERWAMTRTEAETPVPH